MKQNRRVLGFLAVVFLIFIGLFLWVYFDTPEITPQKVSHEIPLQQILGE